MCCPCAQSVHISSLSLVWAVELLVFSQYLLCTIYLTIVFFVAIISLILRIIQNIHFSIIALHVSFSLISECTQDQASLWTDPTTIDYHSLVVLQYSRYIQCHNRARGRGWGCVKCEVSSLIMCDVCTLRRMIMTHTLDKTALVQVQVYSSASLVLARCTTDGIGIS